MIMQKNKIDTEGGGEPLIKNYQEFNTWLDGSNQSRITQQALKKILQKKFAFITAPTQFRMLDVGSSDGEMSLPLVLWLKKKFPNLEYTAIEPERPAFEKLSEVIKRLSLDYAEIYRQTIEEYLIKMRNEVVIFDFILFAQSFYHMPMNEWDQIIADSRRLLKRDGIIIVILDSHKGAAYELKNLITNDRADTLEFGDLYSAENMEHFLEKQGISYTVEKLPTKMFVLNKEQSLYNIARHLGFLYRTFPEKILRNHKQEVERFMKQNKRDDKFVIENIVKVIVFGKSSTSSY
jgi:hypothetical protein